MRFVWVMLFVSVLAGCDGNLGRHYVVYGQPETADIDNTSVILDSFDLVWDRTVKDLSQTYFVINNVAKDSRIINMSFSLENPEDYVDCGITKYSFVGGPGGRPDQVDQLPLSRNQVILPVAMPNPYNMTYTLPTTAITDTHLSGRANVYIAPLNNNNTEISVNAMFVFTEKKRYMPFADIRWSPEEFSVQFNTRAQGTTVTDWGTVRCRSTGLLEQEIIRAAKPQGLRKLN